MAQVKLDMPYLKIIPPGFWFVLFIAFAAPPALAQNKVIATYTFP